MKKKLQKRTDPATDALLDKMEAMIGSPDEDSIDEDAESLALYDIDVDELCSMAHERLRKIASQQFWSQGKSVPVELQKALRQLEPPPLEEFNRRLETESKSIVRQLVANAKEAVIKVRDGLLPSSGPILAPAFRNMKSLSQSDKQLLEDHTDSHGGSTGPHRPIPDRPTSQ
jgi:hypothetical protein